ncbi:MAG: hypothetical protein KJT01_11170 [Gemmatimonadetes bacterium]|nr:hypothetical protein [Gemmatimonadota bacterium]
MTLAAPRESRPALPRLRGVSRCLAATIGVWGLLLGSGGRVLPAQESGGRVGTRPDSLGVPQLDPRLDPHRDPQLDSLVARAITRRQGQLADSTLLSYEADAHGFLAFLGQLGDGGLIPPRVVQSEELALRIAWWQPGRSAQRLLGRRDTTLLPAQVQYYRDRYGVVLDNLPDRIRLGDGQDVRDVPHPLGAGAEGRYRYVRGTPVTIQLPGRTILVDEVRFQPRDPSQPAAIGSVYLDRETAAVVRLSMTFTRAAILDTRIESLVVTLENGLVAQRYWLPRRQEVEVVRASTWFELPARGIVRGHWEVGGYTVNEQVPPAVRALPRWSAVRPDSQRAYPFAGRVVDVLPPALQVATPEEVAQARTQAEAAVTAALLSRAAQPRVTGRSVSDLLRANRAEGVAVGAGVTQRVGGALFTGRARYGLGDARLKGQLAVGRVPAFGGLPPVQLFAEVDVRDAGSAERSGVTNSLASALFGSDHTLPFGVRGVGVMGRRSPARGIPWGWRAAYEQEAPLAVVGRPAHGRYLPPLEAWRLQGVRGEVTGGRGWVAGDAHRTRGSWSLALSAAALHGTDGDRAPARRQLLRVVGALEVAWPLAHDRALVLRSWGGGAAAAGGGALPPQWGVYAGGAWSAPGYGYAALPARAALSQRVEFRQPVAAPGLPLGKWGKAPGRVTLAPFAQLTGTMPLPDTRVRCLAVGVCPSAPEGGVWPSVGVGALFFFDLIRADVARGVRDGRWRFAIDIDRSFWGML